MSGLASTLGDRVEAYIALRRSLGYSFCKQASTLHALVRYRGRADRGPANAGDSAEFCPLVGRNGQWPAHSACSIPRFCLVHRSKRSEQLRFASKVHYPIDDVQL